LAPSGLSEYRGGLGADLADLAVDEDAVYAASSRTALGLDMLDDMQCAAGGDVQSERKLGNRVQAPE
jgi:hypothetical protein